MKMKINSLYRKDNLVVLFFVLVLWTGLLLVLHEVLGISPDTTFKTVAITSGVTVLTALSATSAALMLHLKKNKIALYTEEIINSAKN